MHTAPNYLTPFGQPVKTVSIFVFLFGLVSGMGAATQLDILAAFLALGFGSLLFILLRPHEDYETAIFAHLARDDEADLYLEDD